MPEPIAYAKENPKIQKSKGKNIRRARLALNESPCRRGGSGFQRTLGGCPPRSASVVGALFRNVHGRSGGFGRMVKRMSHHQRGHGSHGGLLDLRADELREGFGLENQRVFGEETEKDADEQAFQIVST
jgi:hypothetical protein